jgi:transposase
MRGLLVQCAQLTLSKRGGDSDIRRWGMKLMGDGTNGHSKKRAVVAVARKLAVLLHKLWSGGTAYDPFYHSRREAEKQKAKAA